MAGDLLRSARRFRAVFDAALSFVYLLGASLAFPNGLVIPLLSDFLEHASGDSEAQKQEGELHAFGRLSERLKTFFPRLPKTVLQARRTQRRKRLAGRSDRSSNDLTLHHPRRKPEFRPAPE